MEQFDERQAFIDNLILIVTNKISSKHNQQDIINLKSSQSYQEFAISSTENVRGFK